MSEVLSDNILSQLLSELFRYKRFSTMIPSNLIYGRKAGSLAMIPMLHEFP